MLSKKNLEKLMNTPITKQDEESLRGKQALESGIAHFDTTYFKNNK